MTNVAVIVSNLMKSYRSGHPNAVDGVSFEIPPGQVFGLLGPNGAGKTTTIKMILGLVIPTSGSIKLAGYDISTHRNKALRHAGAVLEGSRNIYWRLSARANLEYFGALRGMHGKALRQRIDELLTLMELSDRADEETREFSRGMQQKVALAIAMLHDPDVLLLDEPTLGLDVQSARTIEIAIRDVVKRGKAVLLTTHQMHLAEKLSDCIYVIHQGRRVAEGTPSEITRQFSGKQTIEIRLAAVFTDTISRLNAKFPQLTATIDGETVILTGPDNISQVEMLSLLDQLDTEGFPILQAGRRATTLEEAFVQLTSEAGKP